jgi:O-methyltransferase
MPDKSAEGPLTAIGKMIDDLTAFMWDAFTALNVNGITGDYAEFGSDGATSIGAAHAVIRHSSVPRHLWAFDSFQGLPEASDALDQHPAFVPGVGQGGVEAFHSRCAAKGIPRDAYTTVEGFFADTLPPLGADGPPADIALAYVDCNLYSSTVTALEFLRPRLKHGMIVAFDDYFCWTASTVSGERMALHEFLTANPDWHFERYKDPTWGAVSYVVERADALTR